MAMKGISDVIAVLLMLIITIALAGLAYTYISGVFTSKTQTISLLSSDCIGGTVTLILKNEGSQNVPAGGITITALNAACDAPTEVGAVNAGSTVTYQITGCTGNRNHLWRIVGQSNTISASVYCASGA